MAKADPGDFIPLTPAVLAILLSLSEGEKHGYAIMKETAQPGLGGILMGPGTLYGSLDRMLGSGFVEESGFIDDERRRYYRLTDLGSRVLAAEVARLDRVVKSARRKKLVEAVR